MNQDEVCAWYLGMLVIACMVYISCEQKSNDLFRLRNRRVQTSYRSRTKRGDE